MTLKGMRKADQQAILDTLGMDRVPATTRGEAVGTSGAASPLPESGPLGAARLTATIPNFETNTRWASYIKPTLMLAKPDSSTTQVDYTAEHYADGCRQRSANITIDSFTTPSVLPLPLLLPRSALLS